MHGEEKEDVSSERDGDIAAKFDELDPIVSATILTQVRRCRKHAQQPRTGLLGGNGRRKFPVYLPEMLVVPT